MFVSTPTTPAYQDVPSIPKGASMMQAPKPDFNAPKGGSMLSTKTDFTAKNGGSLLTPKANPWLTSPAAPNPMDQYTTVPQIPQKHYDDIPKYQNVPPYEQEPGTPPSSRRNPPPQKVPS